MQRDEGIVVRKYFKAYRDGSIDRLFNGNWEKAKLYKYQPRKGAQHRYQVTTSHKGKQHKENVSRLIAEAFIPNPENKPIVFHKDGDLLNDNVENLEWINQHERTLKNYEEGKGRTLKNSGKPCIECGELTLTKTGLCRNCQNKHRIKANANKRKEKLRKKFKEVDLETLDERKRTIITMRSNGSTLQAIADCFGLTRQRVSQIEKKVLQNNYKK